MKGHIVMMEKRGYVYLLQSASGYWKIGRTSNPQDRLKTFAVKLPFEIAYAHLIRCYDASKLEAELHYIFADKQANGEWFALSTSDTVWIKQFSSQPDFDAYCQTFNIGTVEKAIADLAILNRQTHRPGELFKVIISIAALLLTSPLYAGIQEEWATVAFDIGGLMIIAIGIDYIINLIGRRYIALGNRKARRGNNERHKRL